MYFPWFLFSKQWHDLSRKDSLGHPGLGIGAILGLGEWMATASNSCAPPNHWWFCFKLPFSLMQTEEGKKSGFLFSKL